jgi:two-component system invasion response regulator UvrY
LLLDWYDLIIALRISFDERQNCFLMKQVLLADQHSVMRKGIKMLLLENEIALAEHIDEAETEGDITRMVGQKNYHFILLDMRFAGSDFSKMMKWIQVSSPSSHILIFTESAEEVYAMRCLQMGAKGFLRKASSNEQIITAIQTVFNGEKYLSAYLSDLLLNSASNPQRTENPFDKLSQREMEIVTQLDNGKTLKDIGKILKIEYSTVNTYKRRIFEKLNVDNVLTLSRLKQSFSESSRNF